MKNFVFIFCILIILLKTGNVLSDNNIFSVNNIEVDKKSNENKDVLVNQAFKKGFKKLTERLLLEEDYKRLSTMSINDIKKLISYYQIIDTTEGEDSNKVVKVNLFFDKDRIHDFFYQRNILYSDIINTEMIIFPLLIKDKELFIYSKNYFYQNWDTNNSKDLIQYTLPVENIENIQIIKSNKGSIYKLDIKTFFKEYENKNIAFTTIEMSDAKAKIFISTIIENKKLNKTIKLDQKNLDDNDFKEKIILKIKNEIKSLIKSQNLIDIRTPSFLNVEIKLNEKSNLVELNNRLEKIDLIDNFYILKLNKDYVMVKIKYLGKIDKIINKLKNQKIDLDLVKGQWQLKII